MFRFKNFNYLQKSFIIIYFFIKILVTKSWKNFFEEIIDFSNIGAK